MLQRIPVDLTVPSLPALAYVLRHSEHWPRGFRFNYSTCCAMDLASRLWQVSPYLDEPFAAALGMPAKEAYHIFLSGGEWSGGPHSSITPEQVADQIDLYLARQAEGGGEG